MCITTKVFVLKEFCNRAGDPDRIRTCDHLLRRQEVASCGVLLDSEAESITRRAVDMALTGDTAAMRLVMERLLPAHKSRPINIDLPKILSAADVANALSFVVAAVAEGAIESDDAETLSRIVEVKRRSLGTVELDERLTRLEEALSKGKRP